MIEYFENTAWTVKSSLSSSLFKNLEKIFACPWEDKEQLCLLFIKSKLCLCSVLCSPAYGAGPASLSLSPLTGGERWRFGRGRQVSWWQALGLGAKPYKWELAFVSWFVSKQEQNGLCKNLQGRAPALGPGQQRGNEGGWWQWPDTADCRWREQQVSFVFHQGHIGYRRRRAQRQQSQVVGCLCHARTWWYGCRR